MNLMTLPLHPLVVHAAVVLIPLACLAGLVWAGRLRWAWLLRWPTLVTTVIAVVALQVSRMTGDELAHSQLTSAAIERHDQLAGLLTGSFYLFTIAMVLAFWALPVVNPLPDRADRASRGGVLGTIARGLVVVLALSSLVLVVMTGHAGAVAVWTK